MRPQVVGERRARLVLDAINDERIRTRGALARGRSRRRRAAVAFTCGDKSDAARVGRPRERLVGIGDKKVRAAHGRDEARRAAGHVDDIEAGLIIVRRKKCDAARVGRPTRRRTSPARRQQRRRLKRAPARQCAPTAPREPQLRLRLVALDGRDRVNDARPVRRDLRIGHRGHTQRLGRRQPALRVSRRNKREQS